MKVRNKACPRTGVYNATDHCQLFLQCMLFFGKFSKLSWRNDRMCLNFYFTGSKPLTSVQLVKILQVELQLLIPCKKLSLGNFAEIA